MEFNNFKHVHELLDGHPGILPQYGEIRYYKDEELLQWAPGLEAEKVLGMRTFWDLQQSQEVQDDREWQKQMMQLEQRVSEMMCIGILLFSPYYSEKEEKNGVINFT